MAFQDALPELQSVAPLMPGEHAADRKYVVDNFRRQQLVDLAAAYELTIDETAPKHVILPTLQEAEGRGLFQTPALHPLMFQRAGRRADDRPLDRATQAGKTPEEVERLDRQRLGGILRKEGDEPGTIKDLRAQAKAKGINTFGKGAVWIRQQLDEAHGTA